MIFVRLGKWLAARRLKRHAIDDALWEQVVGELPIYDLLSVGEIERVRALTTRFIAEKRFFGAHEFVVDEYVRVVVAAQACRLVLHIGFEYLNACRTIIVYPGGFVAEREVEDENGIVHSGYEELDGEAMYGGAVVFAWDEARPRRDDTATNVVIHEIAHKLDELTGDHNGLPPLRPGMSSERWAVVFSQAYDRLDALVERGEETPIDDYAAENPAEFFSVAVETFFTRPDLLADAVPDVYELLGELFGEDPLAV